MGSIPIQARMFVWQLWQLLELLHIYDGHSSAEVLIVDTGHRPGISTIAHCLCDVESAGPGHDFWSIDGVKPSHMKRSGMLVLPLGGQDLEYWYRLGC